MHQDIILLRISGEDKPELTARMTEVLASYGADILDIGQAVIHDTVSLGIVIQIPPEAESSPIVKDLLFTAHELGVSLKFTPIGRESYEQWAAQQGRDRSIVTLLSRKVTAAQVSALNRAILKSGLSIDVIHRLSGRISLKDGRLPRQASVEFSVRGTPSDPKALKAEFLRISAEMGVDIAFQADNAFRRNRRLVAFDMDSTLIAVEVIDELAKVAGVGDEVSRITEAAMRGEFDFKQSLRRRLGLLKGLPETALAEVAARIPMNEGAQRLLTNLKHFGYKIAILSGGFTYFGNILKQRFGLDYVFANQLEIKDGALTGEVLGEIVDASRKALLLQHIADSEGISLEQVIAVGDGANDLPMLNLAGLGIAYHAKPLVKQGAGQAISTLGLDSILYLMGVRDRDTVD